MGSFSDSCSTIILTYFPNIMEHLKENFNPDQVCLMAGECSAKFHVHAKVTPNSDVGVISME